MLLTTRKYLLIGIGHSGDFKATIDFHQLLVASNNDSPEFIYALQDIGDEILDMKIGETIYVKPDRDDAQAKGVLRRFQ